MKVEIWSDIMCPFCYIGKRKFEAAMTQFVGRDDVEVNWMSFQLDPELQAPAGTSTIQYLADRKGQSLAWSQQAHAQVTDMARTVGLDYRFDKAVVANSFDAHRLIHLAKSKNLGSEAEECIFKAYFTEGEDIADHETLARLGQQIGLDAGEVMQMLGSEAFADAVHAECAMAARLGARGVPFFVVDGKYGVSGAQEPQTFLNVLQKAHDEWKTAQSPLATIADEGASCSLDGENC